VYPSVTFLSINPRKLYIDTGTSSGDPFGHQYAGYYLPYPDSKHEGIVTTITDLAPIMNWVYVDKETHEVKYGVRVDAQPNFTGPFNCTRQDRRLTFDGWEGWCAVEEYPSIWALYYDCDDDGLSSKLPMGTRVLEVELTRKEKRFKKEVVARNEDQKAARAVDPKGETPVEKEIPGAPKAPDTEPAMKAREQSRPDSSEKDVEPSAAQRNTATANSATKVHVDPPGATELRQSFDAAAEANVRDVDNFPTQYINSSEGTASSPIDHRSGSEWSVHGDDFASTRSMSGYTPASSIYGDDIADEMSYLGHDHPPKSPLPPIPPIPDEYRTEAGTHNKDAEPRSRAASRSVHQGNYRRPHVEDDSGDGK
jgi:hypothetical protein